MAATGRVKALRCRVGLEGGVRKMPWVELRGRVTIASRVRDEGISDPTEGSERVLMNPLEPQ